MDITVYYILIPSSGGHGKIYNSDLINNKRIVGAEIQGISLEQALGRTATRAGVVGLPRCYSVFRDNLLALPPFY